MGLDEARQIADEVRDGQAQIIALLSDLLEEVRALREAHERETEREIV